MAWEKSTPTICRRAPPDCFSRAKVMSPDTPHKSRMRASDRFRMRWKVRAAFLHQRRSTLNDNTWFRRSYRGAIEVNISRTARAAELRSVVPSGVAPTTEDLDSGTLLDGLTLLL